MNVRNGITGAFLRGRGAKGSDLRNLPPAGTLEQLTRQGATSPHCCLPTAFSKVLEMLMTQLAERLRMTQRGRREEMSIGSPGLRQPLHEGCRAGAVARGPGCRAELRAMGRTGGAGLYWGRWAELEGAGCRHMKHWNNLGVRGTGSGAHGEY